jgi:hypothetical protein
MVELPASISGELGYIAGVHVTIGCGDGDVTAI